MIVSLRGTHGSGKSTVVKWLLHSGESTPLGVGKKPDGYRVDISWLDRPLYIVGPYETACGGCDAIQPYQLIWPRVVDYEAKGHVVFEGALVSSSYGTIGEASEGYGDQVVFAFLDTPVQTCVERILERRAKKGTAKPFDPKITVQKHKNVLRSIVRIRDEIGRRTVIIDHKRATSQIAGILRRG